jgi:Fic family protein
MTTRRGASPNAGRPRRAAGRTRVSAGQCWLEVSAAIQVIRRDVGTTNPGANVAWSFERTLQDIRHNVGTTISLVNAGWKFQRPSKSSVVTLELRTREPTLLGALSGRSKTYATTLELSLYEPRLGPVMLYVAYVDPKNFVSKEFGESLRRPGDRWAFWYFHPFSIPRELSLDPETIYSLSDADSSLGHLQGLGWLLKDPDLLVGPYLTREALASSRIEGTEASLSDVLQAEIGGAEQQRGDDVDEVTRFLAATRLGLHLLNDLPLTERLIKQVHRELMTGVRGQEKLPGEFRRTPVWIGSPTDSPDTAKYVPPLPEEITEIFSDWERFVNEPSRLPVLVRCALMHYQFETIHPFLDGNGRIGRLLIGLMLINERRLTMPLLYISGYLETHRREYYDRLEAVREEGDIQSYLQFFLTAVSRSAEDAVVRAGKLVELRENYINAASGARSRVGSLIDLIFTNPFLTVARVQKALNVSDQGARNLLADAEGREWIREYGSFGRGGRRYWLAQKIFDIVDAPVTYGEAEDARRS